MSIYKNKDGMTLIEQVSIDSSHKLALDNVIKTMYVSAIDLQEIQNKFQGKFTRAAVMAMSADISDMLMRFRKLSSAIKSGNEETVKLAMAESKLRKLIHQLIVEEFERSNSYDTRP